MCRSRGSRWVPQQKSSHDRLRIQVRKRRKSTFRNGKLCLTRIASIPVCPHLGSPWNGGRVLKLRRLVATCPETTPAKRRYGDSRRWLRDIQWDQVAHGNPGTQGDLGSWGKEDFPSGSPWGPLGWMRMRYSEWTLAIPSGHSATEDALSFYFVQCT